MCLWLPLRKGLLAAQKEREDADLAPINLGNKQLIITTPPAARLNSVVILLGISNADFLFVQKEKKRNVRNGAVASERRIFSKNHDYKRFFCVAVNT